MSHFKHKLDRFWDEHDVAIIMLSMLGFFVLLFVGLSYFSYEEAQLPDDAECIDGKVKFVRLFGHAETFVENIGAENVIDYDNTYGSIAIRYTEVCN